MRPSSIRTLAFVVLSALVLTASCGTLLNPDLSTAGKSVKFE